jgi:hypothetical protein
MDDIVSSYIIEDELPDPKKRRPSVSTSAGENDGGVGAGSGLGHVDFFDRCSILLACNLPVHAGLWLGQYANLLAREEGPLALIRLSGETCETEIFGENLTLPECSDTESNAFLEIAQWLSTTVKRVLIVPSTIDRDDDLLASGLPLQLVTGTDSAAVVGTYQRAKGLFMAAQNAHQTAPTVGLVMVGAEPGIGQKAAAKIQNCATRFLDAEIALDAIVHRMDVMDARERITIGGDSAFEVSEIIAAIRRVSSTPEETVTEVATYIEQSVLQVIDPEEYAELESVFDQSAVSDQASSPADSEGELPVEIDPDDTAATADITDLETNLTHEAPLPTASSASDAHVPAADYRDSQLRPTDALGVPMDLLEYLPDLRPLPIHELEGLIEPGVAYGVDAQQRLHLVVLGSDATALAVAEKLLDTRHNESVLNAVLEKTEIGRLAPFRSGGLQRDILLPETEASDSARLHRGRFKIHLLIGSLSAGPRVVPLDLD